MRVFVSVLAVICVVGSIQAQVGTKPMRLQERPGFSGDVPWLLHRAIHAAKNAHYSGRRTIEFAHAGKSLHHDEIVFRDGERTRVEFPEGSKFAGQIIVEDSNGRKHFFPDRNEVLVLPPRREESFDRLLRLVMKAKGKKVGLTVATGDLVAGFQTKQVVVSDDSGNVTQRIFIEPKSGVVLKRELFDAGGSQVGSFEFSQIDLDPPPFDPSLFQFERRGVRVVTPYDLLRKLVGGKNFDPLALPPASGYKLEQSRIDQIDGATILIESYWSKGGKITVFQLNTRLATSELQRFARGDDRAATVQRGARTLVVVGSLDQDSLNRLAQSLN